MKPTQKYFKEAFSKLDYISNGQSSWYVKQNNLIDLDTKYQSAWCKKFTEFCWLAENILKTFPDASIYLEGNILNFDYPNGKGALYIERYHLDILLPEIEQICNKHNKPFINKNVQLSQTA